MERGVGLAVCMLAALLNFPSASRVPPVPTPALRDDVDSDVRDAVLAAYEQATSMPASGPASGHLGMVLQANSLYEPAEAVLAYERAIRLEPEDFAWRYYLALGLQQLAQTEKALWEFSAAARIRPDYAPAILRKGELLLKLGRFKESGAAYESVVAQDPASAEALYGLARVKYGEGDLAAADDLYRRACQAFPKFGAAYYGLGLTSRSLGRETESEKNFELAKRYTKERPELVDPLLSQLHDLATGVSHDLEEAEQLIKNGKMEEAARLNEKVLKRDPESLTALLNLLLLARFVGRLDGEVEALYTKARGIDARNPLIYTYYGVVMVRQGRTDAAAAALGKAIELNPDDAEPHTWLGELLERQNRPAEAIDHYQRAVAAEPSNAELKMKLWWALIVHDRGREAIPQLLPTVQTEDSSTSMRLVLLGEAYRTVGDFGRSRAFLEQARSRVSTEGQPELLAQIENELKQIP